MEIVLMFMGLSEPALRQALVNCFNKAGLFTRMALGEAYYRVMVLCKRKFYSAAGNAGCARINSSARRVSVLPGSIRGHGDAPLGCGSGTTSHACPA